MKKLPKTIKCTECESRCPQVLVTAPATGPKRTGHYECPTCCNPFERHLNP